MERPKLSHGEWLKIELAVKLEMGKVVTLPIPKNELPLYRKAASTTGFTVEKIAGQGEEFPFLEAVEDPVGDFILGTVFGADVKNDRLQPQRKVVYYKPRKGAIAVSIERPEGSNDHDAFYASLKSLQQEEA